MFEDIETPSPQEALVPMQNIQVRASWSPPPLNQNACRWKPESSSHGSDFKLFCLASVVVVTERLSSRRGRQPCFWPAGVASVLQDITPLAKTLDLEVTLSEKCNGISPKRRSPSPSYVSHVIELQGKTRSFRGTAHCSPLCFRFFFLLAVSCFANNLA